ncbi:MAG: hypothetical protein EOP06_31235 [Proteobacteria bacterium]|nr:MAG: hypothetical protein EOP06_31235 [Pseudomonadota bacterium]
MNTSGMIPADTITAFDSTETELKLGLGVSQRLSLSLLYQGLFSSQSESSRLAGGLNFSF